MKRLNERLEQYSKPLNFLSSRYKQDAFFDSHHLAVKPITVDFCSHTESHSGVSRRVYNSFQYVPVRKTLYSLLQNKAYVESLLLDKCESDVMVNFADGVRCRQHYLFSDRKKLVIRIQLFYDGLGVTNPLRSQGSVHNVGVFFFSEQLATAVHCLLWQCASVGTMLHTRY